MTDYFAPKLFKVDLIIKHLRFISMTCCCTDYNNFAGIKYLKMFWNEQLLLVEIDEIKMHSII